MVCFVVVPVIFLGLFLEGGEADETLLAAGGTEVFDAAGLEGVGLRGAPAGGGRGWDVLRDPGGGGERRED